MYMLYGKTEQDKRFSPMDYNRGVQVVNLIHAKLFTEDEKQKLESMLPDLMKINPEWTFEIRKKK